MYDSEAQKLQVAQQKVRDSMLDEFPSANHPLSDFLYILMPNASLLMLVQVAIMVRLDADV